MRGRPAGSRAGGDAADRPGSRVRADAALTLSGVDEIPGAVGIDPEVVSFLNNRSHTACGRGPTRRPGLTAAVSVTEYPYDVFAAAALAATIDDAETEGRTFSGTEDIADVHTFLGTGEKEGQVGSGPAPREVQRDRAGAGR